MGAVNLILAVVMTVFATVAGEVYNVGESDGWTKPINGHPDYEKWASTKNFKVGDKIVFKYAQSSHNVARVSSLKDFQTCNTTKPYSVLTSGNDTFTITFSGHYYFICTYPDHCRSGQKVNIRVLHPSTPPPPSAPASPIQPLPFPYPPPQVPSPSPVTISTSPAPAKASSPVLPENSPAPFVVVSAPKIAPSVPKSSGSQLGFEFIKICSMIVMVVFYLV